MDALKFELKIEPAEELWAIWDTKTNQFIKGQKHTTFRSKGAAAKSLLVYVQRNLEPNYRSSFEYSKYYKLKKDEAKKIINSKRFIIDKIKIVPYDE